MDAQYIAAHIQCTAKEKCSCMETVEKILILTYTARRFGLLELERQAASDKFSNPPLIRIGVALIVDGTDPFLVKEILENYILTSQLSNKEFLENMVVCTGILAIQQGENPTHIKEKLRSLFGLDFIESFSAYFKTGEIKREVEETLEQHIEKINSFYKTTLLDFIPEQMDDRSIQRLIQELSDQTLILGLAGCHCGVIKLFMKNMGTQRQKSLLEDFTYLNAPQPSIIENSQREIKKIISELEDRGEILLRPTNEGRLSQEEINNLLDNKLYKL